jgi:hypothetical protein
VSSAAATPSASQTPRLRTWPCCCVHARRRRYALVSPQPERPRDRCQGVSEAASDAARHHHEDRFAGSASISPRVDLCRNSPCLGLGRTFQSARAQTVSDDHQGSTRLAACCITGRAIRRSNGCTRGRPCCPQLDVDRTMYDPSLASRLLQSVAEHGGERCANTVPATSSPSTLRRCSASDRVSTTRPVTPRETDHRRWTSSPAQAQAHQAARSITSTDPSTRPRGMYPR